MYSCTQVIYSVICFLSETPERPLRLSGTKTRLELDQSLIYSRTILSFYRALPMSVCYASFSTYLGLCGYSGKQAKSTAFVSRNSERNFVASEIPLHLIRLIGNSYVTSTSSSKNNAINLIYFKLLIFLIVLFHSILCIYP